MGIFFWRPLLGKYNEMFLIAQYYLPYEAKMVDFYGIESIINSEAIQTTGEYNEKNLRKRPERCITTAQ